MKVNYDYDFSGWATKNDVLCADGRVIKRNAFKDCDGKEVPVVWNHNHSDPDMCLGHALLQNRDEGVYAYVKLNDDTDGGKQVKSLVKHGDIKSLSIFANNLKHKGNEVWHGVIRELSVCLSGANRDAVIDCVLCHAEDHAFDDSGVVIYAGDENPIIMHSDENGDILDEYDDYEYVDDEVEDDTDDEDGDEFAHSEPMTVQDVIGTMNSDQLKVMAYMIEQAVEETKKDNNVEDGDTVEHSEEEDMKYNVFEDNNEMMNDASVLAHSADFCGEVINTAMKFGSLKDAVIAHSQEYGIEDIDMLFPDARNYTNKPEFISRRMEWVSKVMNGVHTTPFSRIKTIFADITEDEARARGYIKGNRKVEEVFTLLKRETTPTTIYKKQAIDRDDALDITDFSVIEYIKGEMRIMYEEECARAILIGDGRSSLSPDKVNPNNIRPIWTDDDLFTVKQVVPVASSATDSAKAKAIIKNIIKSRKLYKGSGSPSLFVSEDLLADMLLIEDSIGHYLYESVDKLKTILRVSDIVTVPLFEGLSRVDGNDTKYLAAILVNLNDYNTGTDKGANISFFDDFDIDYNKNKYLMESRFSGALVKPYSAIVYEIVYNLTLETDPEDPSTTVLGKSVSDLQNSVYVHDSSISGNINYVTGYTGFSGDASEQQGNYIALKFASSDDATVTIQTIGGFHDDRVVELDSDKNAVIRIKSNREKLKVTTTLGDETISKTYSFSGLKLADQ